MNNKLSIRRFFSVAAWTLTVAILFNLLAMIGLIQASDTAINIQTHTLRVLPFLAFAVTAWISTTIVYLNRVGDIKEFGVWMALSKHIFTYYLISEASFYALATCILLAFNAADRSDSGMVKALIIGAIVFGAICLLSPSESKEEKPSELEPNRE